jgi:hypothetical protein
MEGSDLTGLWQLRIGGLRIFNQSEIVVAREQPGRSRSASSWLVICSCIVLFNPRTLRARLHTKWCIIINAPCRCASRR